MVSSAPETYTDADGNTLVISGVQLVFREIELERGDAPANCDPAVVEDDDCDEDLELGPLLVDLPLGASGAVRSFSVPVEPGGTQSPRRQLGLTAVRRSHSYGEVRHRGGFAHVCRVMRPGQKWTAERRA